MENYFSQLLSRNAPADNALLLPASLAMPQGQGDLVESFAEGLPVNDDAPANAGDMLQPVFPRLENDRQTYIEQKEIHHHYLQQYFTRVSSEDAEQKPSPAPLLTQHEKQPSRINPGPLVSNPERSNEPEDQDMLPILPVKEMITEKEPEVMKLHPLSSPDPEQKAAELIPAVWLLPPPPAVKAAPLQTPSTNKPAPSLTIGKILIELLPAKLVPPRVINRTSPFQATAGRSSSSTTAFGLGQL